MKAIFLPVFTVLAVASLDLHSQELSRTLLPATISEIGPHHRRWERMEVVEDIFGNLSTNVGHYTELQTGLYFLNPSGQLTASEEKITLLPNGGAAATNGQHKAFFSPNAADPVLVQIQLPEGQLISFRTYGLVYRDVTTGEEVLIAEVKDSVGQLLPSQREVLFHDALTDVTGQIRLGYTKAAFESEIILLERPPPPEAFGLVGENCQIQVWHEVLQAPVPFERRAALAATNAPGNINLLADDEVLTFGQMSIRRGKAFRLEAGADDPDALHVRKSWEQRTEEGKLRQFLIESVAWPLIRPKLQHLPAAPNPDQAMLRPRTRHLAGVPLRPAGKPAPALNKATRPIQMAKLDLDRARPGYVFDYTVINNGAVGMTLQADETYFVSGPTVISGVTRIEGTCVKFANTNNAQLKIQGTIQCLTQPYAPAWFTAVDDCSVGQIIGAVTNVPSGTYAVIALDIDNNNSDLRYLRIAWAKRAINYASSSCYPHFLYHSQILNCNQGLVSASPVFHVRNALFCNVLTNFDTTASGITGHCEHLSVSTATKFNNSANLTLNVTNSALVNITTPGTYSGANNYVASASNSVWRAVKGGGHYPLDGSPSPLRNAGTTNISSQLRADLAGRTTYPPILLGSSITTPQVWVPQAQRDVDTPDIGYSYEPIDHITSGTDVNSATLFLTNAVVLASAANGDGYGLKLYGTSKLISEGTPVNPNRIVRYRTVQENPVSTLESYSHTIGLLEATSGVPEVHLRHTAMSLLVANSGSAHIDMYGAAGGIISLRDCKFHVGRVDANNNLNNVTFDCYNSLLERVALDVRASPANIYNNTLIGGSISLYSQSGQTYTVRDNLFDKTAVYNNASGTLVFGYNGYVSGYSRLIPNGPNDVILSASPSYETGPLGRFYLPASSSLIDVGSRTAASAGLYHHTCKVNQNKEASGTVDVGYHFVVVNPGQAEIEKYTMQATASSSWSGWDPAYAINGSVSDPGWVNTNPTTANEFLRINLWSSKIVDRVAYIPRAGTTITPPYDGNSNGSFRDWRVYVSTSSSSNPVDWGDPVATGQWNWPNGAERREIEFSAKTGQYIYFYRVSAFGWYGPYEPNSPPSYGYAGANEVWIYERKSQVSSAADTDSDGVPDYFEDRNGDGSPSSGESHWNDASDLGIKVTVTHPKRTSNIP